MSLTPRKAASLLGATALTGVVAEEELGVDPAELVAVTVILSVVPESWPLSR